MKPTDADLSRAANSPRAVAPRAGIALPGTVALVVLALAGLNAGLMGIAGLDLIAWLFGPMSIATRAVYVIVGLAAVFCLACLPRWSRAG